MIKSEQEIQDESAAQKPQAETKKEKKDEKRAPSRPKINDVAQDDKECTCKASGEKRRMPLTEENLSAMRNSKAQWNVVSSAGSREDVPS